MIDLGPLARHMPVFQAGTVWLVGAGPGDPGLLTAAAIHALQTADAIVYDALVSEEILTLARPEAGLEFAGKRGGKPSPRQPDITRRLIELARAGRRVLRLKGGDPFVFGRGGEEAMALAAAGVGFRVVPGVTAGIGGLAAAHIPLTTRETNHAVILMTGHLAAEADAAIDWRAMVATGAPIVLYMAIAAIGRIAEGLAGAGMAADMPVAVVARATMPDQRVLVTTLAEAERDLYRSGIAAPAIVAIGPIVRLRAALLGAGVDAPVQA